MLKTRPAILEILRILRILGNLPPANPVTMRAKNFFARLKGTICTVEGYHLNLLGLICPLAVFGADFEKIVNFFLIGPHSA